MSGARGGLGRIVAIGVALALALSLALAAEAGAGYYTVAQCGWYVGADADWAETTGSGKFSPDACGVPPAGADPFATAQLRNVTNGGGTVSGNRFARWRWNAPTGTYISQLRGTWWHVLHDGFERRIGAINWAGGFEQVLGGNAPDPVLRQFALGFPVPIAGFEDRLLCARGVDRWCSLSPGSWSALRALTITLVDERNPGGGIGGELTAGGWRRGVQAASIGGNDIGSGVRYGETLIDGARVALTEYPCEKAFISGEWRATRMHPCLGTVSQTHMVNTAAFGDGPHTLVHCISDFSGNTACSVPRAVHFDNNPPAAPREARVEGAQGWRRVNDFDLAWANPGQGAASPIVGAGWRLTGPSGHDSGVRFAGGLNRGSLVDLKVPGPGSHTVALWLRDEAGNEAPSAAVGVPLRFDDVRPAVDFLPATGEQATVVEAEVTDAHSGPAKGELFYRRNDSERWSELPAKLVAGAAGKARLRAPLPELAPGTYLFRADVADTAGNTASSGRLADGAVMTIHRAGPVAPDDSDALVEAARPAPGERAKSRLFARLEGGRGKGESRTVRFGQAATLSGRLTRADGAGLAGRELRVVARPSRGALAPVSVRTVRSGERGRFQLPLGAGTSRRVSVGFAGDGEFSPAARRPLELRVRSGVSLEAERTELRTGEVLRMSGRVSARGTTIPRRGKLVAIHYLERETDRWRPVLVTRTDHDGRFRARYRFRYINGRARIQLRATVLAEERWPYVPGSSRPLSVEVRGR